GVARGLVRVGCPLAHPVQTAMDIGVLRFHRMPHRLDHGTRLLRRSGAVQEHEILATNLLRQDRKVGANLLYVHARPSHQRATVSASRSRAVSFVTGSRASARNARTRIARASLSEMPRLRR